MPPSSLDIATFDRFEDAYLAVLRHVSDHHEFVNAPRGNAARECLNISFRLSHPRDRIPYLASRRVNVMFHFAEALWYLLGRDDVEMISYYAPQMREYSVDGRIRGSAYGSRLFAPQIAGELSAFDKLLKLLREEEATKRAVSISFDPTELDIPDNPDVSCMIALQFLVRDGALHLVCFMRANDAYQGLVSDVFSFTLLQEFTAHQLGIRLGTYGHHVGSMHIGDKHADRVERMLADQATGADRFPRYPPLVMPPTSWADLEVLAEHEEALRLDRSYLTPTRVENTGLAPYWRQVLLLMEIQRQITHHPSSRVSADVLAALDPGYRWLVTHRWSDRMPVGFVPIAARSS